MTDITARLFTRSVSLRRRIAEGNTYEVVNGTKAVTSQGQIIALCTHPILSDVEGKLNRVSFKTPRQLQRSYLASVRGCHLEMGALVWYYRRKRGSHFCIRNDHFAQRQSIEEWPYGPAVIVRDSRYRDAFPLTEGYPTGLRIRFIMAGLYIPTCMLHFCHSTTCPVTLKLGPSG
jgi:hypothetical protein